MMEQDVTLSNGHIIIPAGLAREAFGSEQHVSWAFYPERNTLVLAAKSKGFFEKLHKTQEWQVLKDKNLRGDKSLFVRSLLLDHDLDETERPLSHDLKHTGILSVRF